MHPFPPLGLYLHVNFVRAKDGDTVVVSLPLSSRPWSVRLIGVNCPELHKEGGIEAKEFTESVLGELGVVKLFIPVPHTEDILRSLSFERLLGHIYVSDTRTLAEMLVETGHGKVSHAG